MSRKTVEVEYIKERVNIMLANPSSAYGLHDSSGDWSPEQAFRMGAASLLELLLHATGNYRGFNFQPSEFLPGDEQDANRVLRDDSDATRRYYY